MVKDESERVVISKLEFFQRTFPLRDMKYLEKTLLAGNFSFRFLKRLFLCHNVNNDINLTHFLGEWQKGTQVIKKRLYQ